MNRDEPAAGNAHPPRVSYAQNHEDILLDRVFNGKRGSYVDIGVNDPVRDNNTYFFYERGWRGVNIEPASSWHAEIERRRPGDLNLRCAVSDHAGTARFYEVEDATCASGLSTLDADHAASLRDAGREVRAYDVEVRTLAELIDAHELPPPDFVSIDVEGHEEAVLLGIPLDRWRPKAFVIEATEPMTNVPCHQAWEPILLRHGYLFACFNGINRFYVRADLASRIELLSLPLNVLDNYVPAAQRDLENRAETLWQSLQRTEADRVWERGHLEERVAGWRSGFEESRRAFEELKTILEREHADLCAERLEHQRRKDEIHEFLRLLYEERVAHAVTKHVLRAEVDGRDAEISRLRDAIEQERSLRAHALASSDVLIHEAHQRLRPYRLIDRLGVVTAGYEWARRVKHGLASRSGSSSTERS